MKALIFDTGPIITLTLNNLLWLLDPLKKQFSGEFYITDSVRKELIDRPLEINRFKFEAIYTMRYIRKGTITVYPLHDYSLLADRIFEMANSIFSAQRNYIQIVHRAEIETIALAKSLSASAIVVDERTTLELIENPDNISYTLSKKLHTKVAMNRENLLGFQKLVSGVKVIQSVNLALIAYEMGLLDQYLPDEPFNQDMLLDAMLWGLKLNGCAISEEQIEDLIKIEKKSA